METAEESSLLEQPIRSSDIVAINPIVTGIVVAVRCRHCGREFEKFQPTVDTLAFGKYTCPGCKTIYDLWPEDFLAALSRIFPYVSDELLSKIQTEGSRIAKTWYRVSPLAEVLTYRDINLGQPTERVLLSFILTGLFMTQLAGQREK